MDFGLQTRQFSKRFADHVVHVVPTLQTSNKRSAFENDEQEFGVLYIHEGLNLVQPQRSPHCRECENDQLTLAIE